MYKVGDKVKIKTWEELVNEYGTLTYFNPTGSNVFGIEGEEELVINTPGLNYFSEKQKDICGKVVTITEINGSWYKFNEHESNYNEFIIKEKVETHRYKIHLDTETDVVKFVNVVGQEHDKVKVTDGEHIVDAHSLLGMLYALTFNELWCESDNEIYHLIRDFMGE